MSIQLNINFVRKQLPAHVSLVCVSKFHSDDLILEAYNIGERIFGESKVQELAGKYERLPKDIKWHFIGHLQSNKVKYIVDFVELIHGVDSVKLLDEINKQAAKVRKKVNCLLQVHIATEETKFGFDESEIVALFNDKKLADYPNINFCGLMGMATFTENKQQVKTEFQLLNNIFEKLKKGAFSNCSDFKTLSMGMSDDFPIAIEAGSNLVRVGSLIFGNRNYT